MFAARAPRRGVRRRFKCLVSALADDVARTKTPHSGFHRDGPREFMEGWYWRVRRVPASGIACSNTECRWHCQALHPARALCAAIEGDSDPEMLYTARGCVTIESRLSLI